MAKWTELLGATDVTIPVFLQDAISGLGKPGLVAADLACTYYRRRSAAAAIALIDLVAVDSAHADGGLKEIDAVNMSGHYRLDLPDAVCAAGSPFAAVTVSHPSCVPCNVEIPLSRFESIARELLNSRIHDIDSGLHQILDEAGQAVLGSFQTIGSISATGFNWTNATKRLTKAGAFAGLPPLLLAGATVTLTAGTGVTLGTYTIDHKADDDSIELTTDINGTGGDVADDSIEFTIETGKLFVQRS